MFWLLADHFLSKLIRLPLGILLAGGDRGDELDVLVLLLVRDGDAGHGSAALGLAAVLGVDQEERLAELVPTVDLELLTRNKIK